MRSLTSAARTKIQTKTATEPIVIIEVIWADGSVRRYADRDHQNAKGKILDISGFDATQRLQGGQSITMTMTIDDSDSDILNLLKNNDPHKAFVRVWQSFVGLSSSSNFILFTGQVNSPIVWNEGERTYTISVVTEVEGREVGFSPESGFFEFVDPDVIGKPWPICFGEVVRVPAQRITPRIEGGSLTRYRPITLEALTVLEDKIKKYTVMLAKVGLADNVLNIEDIEVVILNDDYIDLLEEISKGYSEFTSIVEDLIINNPGQTDSLNTFVEQVILISLAGFQIGELNKFLANLFKSVEVNQNEADDLERAIKSEEDKAPFENQELIIEMLINKSEKDGAVSALFGLQTALLNLGSDLQAAILEATITKDAVVLLMTTFTLTNVFFQSNEIWPQGDTELIINKQRFSGTITDKNFTLSGVPLVHDLEVITLAARQNSNPNEFWINDWSTGETPLIRNRFLLIHSQDFTGVFRRRVVFCTQQEGSHCFFAPLVYEERDGIGNDPDDLRKTYGFKLFDTNSTIEAMAPSYLADAWKNLIDPAGQNIPGFVNGLYQLQVSDWALEVGDRVSLGSSLNEVYIVNLYESEEVTEVMAYKNQDGKRFLSPLPEHYYEIDLAFAVDTGSGIPSITTAITLQRPLTDYEGENWEDGIFVTLVSTLTNNSADIIKWLINNWTSLSVDATSFSAVASSVNNFPANFALLTKKDSIDLIQDIAYQSRCAVWVTDNKVFIKYLSKEPSKDITIREDDIIATTLQLTLTDTEELITILEGTWREDYATPEPHKIILRNNVPLYGVHKEERDFFIYNIEEMVQRSMTFWIIRKSNTWKRIIFQGFLNLLELEVFDTIEFSLTEHHFSNSPVKAVIESIEYDSNDNSLRITTWLPIRSGFMSPYVFAWPSSANAGLIYPTSDDPHAGGG